jgi:hypothetical protein
VAAKHRTTLSSDLRAAIAALVTGFLMLNTVLFGFMHVPLAARARAGGDDYVPVFICTINGIQPLDLIDGSNGAKNTAKYDGYGGYQCALCAKGLHTMAPPMVFDMPVMTRLELSHRVRPPRPVVRDPGHAGFAASPRAPPRTSSAFIPA